MIFKIEYMTYLCNKFGGIQYREIFMFGDIDSVIKRFKMMHSNYAKVVINNIEAL